MEPAPAQPAETRSAESGIQSASILRRLLATAVDGLILIASLSAFAAIFLRFNNLRGPLPVLAGVAATLAIAFWFTYQYLLIVYTGSTPGLRAARLKIARFDGSPVTRRLRRWRVLASLLSALSAGLGYLWCFLDADSLCWHDRITRTHLRAEQMKSRAAGLAFRPEKAPSRNRLGLPKRPHELAGLLLALTAALHRGLLALRAAALSAGAGALFCGSLCAGLPILRVLPGAA